jgi:hypothetical protein
MLTAGHVLIAFAIVAAWLLSLWAHPFGRCWRCHGRRVLIKGSQRKPRPVKCWACKGVGRRQRLGSRTLHRTVRRVRRELDRQRKQRQQAIEERSQ